MRRIALLAVLVVVLGPRAVGAQDGPRPTDTSPEQGGVVTRAPDEVSMTFDEPLDPSSRLEVHDECGRLVSGDTEITVDEMSTPLTLKPKGHYVVSWSATGLAGASGTRDGTWAFHVREGNHCDPDENNGNHHHNNNENGNEHNNHGNNKNGGHRNGGGDGHHSPGGDSHPSGHTTTTHSTTHGDDTGTGAHAGGHRTGNHEMRGKHGGHGEQSGDGRHVGHRERGDGRDLGDRSVADPGPAPPQHADG
jgi:methionine-rich copper-binding protein CopC